MYSPLFSVDECDDGDDDEAAHQHDGRDVPATTLPDRSPDGVREPAELLWRRDGDAGGHGGGRQRSVTRRLQDHPGLATGRRHAIGDRQQVGILVYLP